MTMTTRERRIMSRSIAWNTLRTITDRGPLLDGGTVFYQTFYTAQTGGLCEDI